MWVLGQSVLTQTKNSLRLGPCQKISLCLRFLNHMPSKVHDEIESVTNATKIIKVALIGRPNSGKSTLINQIVGRSVTPVSMKSHTTRVKVKAFANVDDTQIVFLDTPGLVSSDEVKKWKFETEFLKSAENAIQDADIIGVLHDVSWSRREKLDPSVVRHLLLYQRKKTFLLLNKVDAIKKKDSLLHVVQCLTKKPKSPVIRKGDLTEQEVAALSQNISSWPHFCEIFMISALEGDGVGDVKEYLLNEAQPGQWMFTDNKPLNPHRLAVDFVKAACLDYLADEVPYKLKFKLNYFEDHGDSCAVEVVILAPNKRHLRMTMDRVRPISQYAEANLSSALEKECRLLLNIQEENEF